MTTNEYTSTILTAEEGKYLTQTADVELLDRIIATKVAVSANSSASDWKEITKEEGDALISAQNEARQTALQSAE